MDLIKKVKELNSIEFNPMQKKAIEKGLFDSNVIVSSPTASGKTLIAEISALNSIIKNKKKVIYACPLKALASEHFNEFKKKYSKELNIKTTISTGDFDSSSKYLQNYDIIFTTYEKTESLLRHRAEWLSSIGLLIVDEIHEIDSDRGPTIEIMITKLLLLNPKMQVLGLSATIPNAKELSEWLNAKLITSSFRPVKLNEGVFFDQAIHFLRGKERIESSQDSVISLSLDAIKKDKQALVFCNTRRSSISTAKKLAKTVEKNLLEKEKKFLSQKSAEILNSLDNPTEQCRILSNLVKSGVAFHNAGMLPKQRTIIENLFRKRILKVVSATPTLCVIPETKIWNGLKDIKVDSFSFNQRLLALKNSKLASIRPKKIVKNENTRSIIQLKSVSGFSVKLTDNHKVWIKRNRKKMFIAAGECVKGDKIAVVGNLWVQRGEKFKLNYFSLDLPELDKHPNKTFFYFIGAMLGDGYSGTDLREGKLIFKANPCLVGKDSEIFDYAKQFCKEHGLHFRETVDSYGTPVLYFTKTKWFRMLLANCGVVKGERKFIAEELKLFKKSFLVPLIQGLFDTDGWVHKERGLGFSNISLSLIKDLQRLLLAFGIVSRFRKRKGTGMKIYEKTYKTKETFEITIMQKKSILKFKKKIGFKVKRKQKMLDDLIDSINLNCHFVSCKKCGYKIFHDVFSGRTREQKKWGKKRRKVIEFLGDNGNTFSDFLTRKMGFIPYKGEKTLDHHFELINRKRIGNKKEWRLNEIGKFIYHNFILKSRAFESFFNLQQCPLCKKQLFKKIENGWREEDFEGDIFWDFISKVKTESRKKHPFVYDVVLPSNGSNDHLFVAEGFLVHNSAGINMPAFRVIIPSVYRYTVAGMQKIPIREYKQMAGRCGRPRFDSVGQSVLIAGNEFEAEELKEEFILGEIEDVSSKLGIEPVLRTHVLAAIATGFAFDLASLEKFFSKTFYAHQFDGLEEIFLKINSVLMELKEMNFIQGDHKSFKPTLLGKRIAELYLDPLTAKMILNSFERPLNNFSFLFLLCSAFEFYPLFSVPKSREAELWEKMSIEQENLPINLQESMSFDVSLLKKYNSALLLGKWIEEFSEESLGKEFNVQPGILHSKLLISDWLLYCFSELALISGNKSFIPLLSKLRRRVKYGVKEELLSLTELKGIGRVRARKLFNSNLTSISLIKKTELKNLAGILGKETAFKIKKQLGQISQKELNSIKETVSEQTNLENF